MSAWARGPARLDTFVVARPAPDYGLVDSLDYAGRVVGAIQGAAAKGLPFGIDIETGYDGPYKEKAQLHPEEGFIVGISLTCAETWARYLPLRHDSGPNLDETAVAELLWPLMRTKQGLAYNAVFESRFLSRWFTEHLIGHPVYGPQVMDAHLGNPAYTGYFGWRSDPMLEIHAEGMSKELSLKARTLQDFGHQMMTIEELFSRCGFGTGKALTEGGPKSMTTKQMAALKFNELDLLSEHRQAIVDYACEDALWQLVHHNKRYPQLTDPRSPRRFIYQLEMAVMPIVCAMEDEGLLYDWAYMRDGSQRAEAFLERYTAEIQDDLTTLLRERGFTEDCAVNLASPAQLAKVLYAQLGFRVPVYTKKTDKGGGGNPSTGKVAMQALRGDHPIIQKIINHKSLTRLNGTYLKVYEKFGYGADGRTHPDWMQCGVPAGRFACAWPPVQQSPKFYRYVLNDGDVFEYDFRYALHAPEGWYILGFDYAQMERRALAGEAGDEALLEAFNSGVDIHKATAAGLFGKSIEDITKDERGVGKTIGFAMDYGLGDDGMADRLGVPLEQAQLLREKYFAAYARLKPYTESVIATAHRQGYLITTFGRRVPIWGIDDPRPNIRSGAERTAGNAAIQGPATGDYPKIAMVRSHLALKQAGLLDKVRLVMNMHDALEWYVRKDVNPVDVIRVLQPAVVFNDPRIAHWPKIVAEWHAGLRWSQVKELDVTLDEAGKVTSVKMEPGTLPDVHETGGDEDEEFQPDAAAVRAVLGATELGTSGETSKPQPVAVGPGGDDGVPADLSLADAGVGPLVISVPKAPSREALTRLVALLRSRNGAGGPVLLQAGGGEFLLADQCSLTPAEAPEIALLLGQYGVTVTYRSPV